MKAIFNLAIKNLREHKSKTAIISLFLVFGIAIVILGNSFLESVNRGLEKDFRENYTGDVAIGAKEPKGVRVDIFGVNSVSMSGELPQIDAILDLEKVERIIAEESEIVKKTKLISAQVLIAKGVEIDMDSIMDREDLTFDDLPISMLFAGEDETYWKTFPSVHFTEGAFPAANTNEIMIDTRVKNAFESLYREKLNVGDTVLLCGANGLTIREAKLVGIFNPPNENSAMFQIIYCNPSLARSFADLTYGSNFSQELPDSVDLGLSDFSEEDLFNFDDDFFTAEAESFTSDFLNFDDILGDTALRDKLNQTDDGAWQFILTKVEHPLKIKQTIAKLNARFEQEGLEVRAMDWKEAAYSYSGTVEGIGFIFNLLIIILAVVVFIIIMNTMTVSVIERTSEIGTMRAIGAEKKFVKALFNTEAVFLTMISAVAGIILAFIVMIIFNACNVTITNSIAKMILGGGLLHFNPTWKIIIFTVLVALFGSVISNKYPVSYALKITPLKALSKGSE